MHVSPSSSRKPFPRSPRGAIILFVTGLVLTGVGCDKPSHEKIEKWVSTQKGPGKIESALKDSDLDADLRAHAAQALVIHLNKDGVVKQTLEKLGDGKRQPILAKLIPRLWEDARITGDPMQRPSPRQMLAKDFLFYLRDLSDDSNRATIDGYLIDWLTSGFYDGRAESGTVRGEIIMRQVGDKKQASDKLIAATNSEIAQNHVLTDNLLLGLAAVGSSEAVAKLLDLAAADLHDDTLRTRIFTHLYNTYVKPQYFEAPNPAALIPHIATLEATILDQNEKNENINSAMSLVELIGPPDCLPPFLRMISAPHYDSRFRWIGAKKALKCGGLEAVEKVLEGFTTKGSYREIDLDDALWLPMAQMEPKAKVAELARSLLKSNSWVARLTGIKVLGKLALVDSAASDAALVAELDRDKTVLQGWWGDQSELPKKKRMRTPTLGEIARQVAGQLEELAKSTQK